MNRRLLLLLVLFILVPAVVFGIFFVFQGDLVLGIRAIAFVFGIFLFGTIAVFVAGADDSRARLALVLYYSSYLLFVAALMLPFNVKTLLVIALLPNIAALLPILDSWLLQKLGNIKITIRVISIGLYGAMAIGLYNFIPATMSSQPYQWVNPFAPLATLFEFDLGINLNPFAFTVSKLIPDLQLPSDAFQWVSMLLLLMLAYLAQEWLSSPLGNYFNNARQPDARRIHNKLSWYDFWEFLVFPLFVAWFIFQLFAKDDSLLELYLLQAFGLAMMLRIGEWLREGVYFGKELAVLDPHSARLNPIESSFIALTCIAIPVYFFWQWQVLDIGLLLAMFFPLIVLLLASRAYAFAMHRGSYYFDELEEGRTFIGIYQLGLTGFALFGFYLFEDYQKSGNALFIALIVLLSVLVFWLILHSRLNRGQAYLDDLEAFVKALKTEISLGTALLTSIERLANTGSLMFRARCAAVLQRIQLGANINHAIQDSFIYCGSEIINLLADALVLQQRSSPNLPVTLPPYLDDFLRSLKARIPANLALSFWMSHIQLLVLMAGMASVALLASQNIPLVVSDFWRFSLSLFWLFGISLSIIIGSQSEALLAQSLLKARIQQLWFSELAIYGFIGAALLSYALSLSAINNALVTMLLMFASLLFLRITLRTMIFSAKIQFNYLNKLLVSNAFVNSFKLLLASPLLIWILVLAWQNQYELPRVLWFLPIALLAFVILQILVLGAAYTINRLIAYIGMLRERRDRLQGNLGDIWLLLRLFLQLFGIILLLALLGFLRLPNFGLLGFGFSLGLAFLLNFIPETYKSRANYGLVGVLSLFLAWGIYSSLGSMAWLLQSLSLLSISLLLFALWYSWMKQPHWLTYAPSPVLRERWHKQAQFSSYDKFRIVILVMILLLLLIAPNAVIAPWLLLLVAFDVLMTFGLSILDRFLQFFSNNRSLEEDLIDTLILLSNLIPSQGLELGIVSLDEIRRSDSLLSQELASLIQQERSGANLAMAYQRLKREYTVSSWQNFFGWIRNQRQQITLNPEFLQDYALEIQESLSRQDLKLSTEILSQSLSVIIFFVLPFVTLLLFLPLTA